MGNRTDFRNYNQQLWEQISLLPFPIEPLETLSPPEQINSQQISSASFNSEWLENLRNKSNGGFLESEFTRWWPLDESNERSPFSQGEPSQEQEPSDGSVRSRPNAIVAARLSAGAPLLVEHKFGAGRVLLMTSSLDADWNSLPAKPDYVTFLHEAIFHLAAVNPPRNVQPGSPLMLPVENDSTAIDYRCLTPTNEFLIPELHDAPRHSVLRIDDTTIAGRYIFQPRNLHANPERHEQQFIVNFDRRESDLTPLDNRTKSALDERHQLTFIGDTAGWAPRILQSHSRHEFWSVLMTAALIIFVLESVLTRRIARQSSLETTSNHVIPTSKHRVSIADILNVVFETQARPALLIVRFQDRCSEIKSLSMAWNLNGRRAW